MKRLPKVMQFVHGEPVLNPRQTLQVSGSRHIGEARVNGVFPKILESSRGLAQLVAQSLWRVCIISFQNNFDSGNSTLKEKRHQKLTSVYNCSLLCTR
jgi:hypothetical protein